MSKPWKTCSCAWARPKVYFELLQLLLDVLGEQIDAVEVENNNLDALVHNKSKLDLDCE